MITVQGITKRFGDITAVNNISFTIKEGEITGLLGPNGAGKTTTLRMLTGYLKPDSGTITIGDFSVNDDSVDVRRIVGYLPESAPVYGDMLVYDYLSFIAEVRGIADEKRIEEIGALCGINDVMHQGIGELSKGYRQRVGLAQSMIHDPEILILDEPTSGLDPNQIIEIRNLIREIGKKKTIILSTHILPEVEATCDRVIIIDRGSIAADDRTEILQAASGGENLVTVRITGADFGQLKGELMKLPGVTRVDELPDSDLVAAQVTAGGTADIRPEIFRMVSGRNWTLYEMMLEQRSLERVFRDLTAGGGK
ncbi:MAG TPA: ATP-binding cassette domain-containing protein [Spirochaetota bacterium]|nr:ATP-binding cassette domain-containing protein [Spirochaetota bacterium]HPG49222.1 ATP-binding cassette domain-containing protein [Spirochaetota bacterium]HQL82024.1 ATP-binding cassette domain-containing protein [Spirochaetota bacterium]